MKPIRTLVLLADDGKARFLENAGIDKGVQQIEVLEAASPAGYADMPGRSQAGADTARHGLARPTGEEGAARDVFADAVLDKAGALWAGGDFQRLVMAAPPKMLGVLRSKLSPPLDDALVGDLDKDLTNLPEAELPGQFADVVAF